MGDAIVDLVCAKMPLGVPLSQGKIASFWCKFVDFVPSSGTFGNQYGGGGVEAMSAKLGEFPKIWQPIRGQKRYLGPENYMRVEEIYQVLRGFLSRNCPIPLTARRYTVERCCWRCLPIIIVPLMSEYLPEWGKIHPPLEFVPRMRKMLQRTANRRKEENCASAGFLIA